MNKERVLALLRGDGFTVFGYFLSLIIASALLPVLGTKIALVQEGLLALLMVLLFLLHRDTLWTKLSGKLVIKSVLYGLLAVLIELVLIIITVLITKVSIQSHNTSAVFSMIKGFPVFALYTVVIAPIVEELVFRQSFFNLCQFINWRIIKSSSKRARIFKWIISAFVTAIIFASLHADIEVWEYVLISLFLQWLLHHYKDIRVCMIAHGIFNLSTLLLLMAL